MAAATERATGSTSSSAPGVTRSRPGRARSSATSSPSACSAFPAVDRDGAPLMDFTFTPEQEDLRREARSFLEANPSASMDQLRELGWVGILQSDEFDFVDAAVLFEELGRALYDGPYVLNEVAGQPGDETWSIEVDGFVPHLEQVDRVLRPDMTSLEAQGTAVATVDETLRLGVVSDNGSRSAQGEWEQVRLRLLAALALDAVGIGSKAVATVDETLRLGVVSDNGSRSAQGEWEQVRLRLLAALALDAVGIGSKAVELAIAYVGEREQFGKKIGTYQAVSHSIVDAYVAVELARSLAYWAAWTVAEGDEQAPLACAAANSQAAEAAVSACERSIQVHGGIGFTWEHVLHRYYKRALWTESALGYGREHRAEVAASLLR